MSLRPRLHTIYIMQTSSATVNSSRTTRTGYSQEVKNLIREKALTEMYTKYNMQYMTFTDAGQAECCVLIFSVLVFITITWCHLLIGTVD